MEEKSMGHALRGYRRAARAAKAFQIAHGVALGYAATALVVGGVKIVKTLRGEESDPNP